MGRFIVSIIIVMFIVWFLMMLFRVPLTMIRTYRARVEKLEEDIEDVLGNNNKNNESESV